VTKARLPPAPGGALIGVLAACAWIAYTVIDARIDKHSAVNLGEAKSALLACALIVATPLICWIAARILRLPSAAALAFAGMPAAAVVFLPFLRLVPPWGAPPVVLALTVIPAVYAVLARLLSGREPANPWRAAGVIGVTLAVLSLAVPSPQGRYLREERLARLQELPRHVPDVAGFTPEWLSVEDGYLFVVLKSTTPPVTTPEGWTKEIYPLLTYVRSLSHPFDPARDCVAPGSRWKEADRCRALGPGRWISSDGKLLVIRDAHATYFIRDMFGETEEYLTALDVRSRPLTDQEVSAAVNDTCERCRDLYF
jgi:hypothetical protein